jgi:hypothetical protein
MNWLRDHVFLATWLALPIMIVAAIVQNWGKQSSETDWSRLLLQFAFLTALCVAFTTTLDGTARDLARYLVCFLLVFLIWDVKPRR